MRVLVTLNSLDLGGTQINAVDYAWAARRHGVESVLVGHAASLPAAGPSLLDVAAERDVDLVLLDGAPGTILQASRDLADAARHHGADLVHAYSSATVRYAFWAPCRLGRRPLVMTVYEMDVCERTPRRPPLIVGTRYLLEEQGRARPGPVHLLSPPVDLDRDHPAVDTTDFVRAHRLDPTKARVVIVTRLEDLMKARAVEDAIAAIDRLGRPDLELVVVGAGAAAARLRKLGDVVNDRLGQRAVVFTGPAGDPRPAYASADVVIGMGGSAARALAFARTLIVSGEHGWYRTFGPASAAALYRDSFWSRDADPEPVRALAGRIDALIDDAAARAELGRFGRAFAARNFSLEAMSSRLVAVYRAALADHRRRRWFADLGRELSPAARYVVRRAPGGRT